MRHPSEAASNHCFCLPEVEGTLQTSLKSTRKRQRHAGSFSDKAEKRFYIKALLGPSFICLGVSHIRKSTCWNNPQSSITPSHREIKGELSMWGSKGYQEQHQGNTEDDFGLTKSKVSLRKYMWYPLINLFMHSVSQFTFYKSLLATCDSWTERYVSCLSAC